MLNSPVISSASDVMVKEAPGKVHVVMLYEGLQSVCSLPVPPLHHLVHLLLAAGILHRGHEKVEHLASIMITHNSDEYRYGFDLNMNTFIARSAGPDLDTPDSVKAG